MLKNIFVVLSFLSFFIFFSSSVLAVDVSACTTIAAAGTYDLTQDISTGSGTCIDIQADNVNLNCNGYRIYDSSSASYGVQAVGTSSDYRENISVYNCVIDDFSSGIYFENVLNSDVFDSIFSGNSNAVYQNPGDKFSIIKEIKVNDVMCSTPLSNVVGENTISKIRLTNCQVNNSNNAEVVVITQAGLYQATLPIQ